MRKALALRWAKALRSKKYTQGRLFLRNRSQDGEITHCCLGVLYEVAIGKTGPNRPLLTKNILRQVGMSAASQMFFTVCNDDRCWKFPKIATWIEKNYKKIESEI